MKRELVVIGAPSSAGSYAPGQERAPAALREFGLIERLARAGRDVYDAGDGPLQVWVPDPAHRFVQNLAAVVLSVRAVADQVGAALDRGADVLVLGGNCTVALGVMDAVTLRDPAAGLLYIDRQFDLNTPASTSDGALDWMGLAHGLDLPNTAEELASAFHRRPLLRPEQLYLLGVDHMLATAWEQEQVHRLGLRWGSHAELAADPVGQVTNALAVLPSGLLAVHLDVDALDFTDAPLAENTDGRNSGPTLDAITHALAAACADARFRVLSIGELNPARAAGHPQTLHRFISTLQTALTGPG
ncbi:MAG: arginase [Pseudonocardiales bacterium]|nr:MAG: arginase [Pseudonocardiales bacterium]